MSKEIDKKRCGANVEKVIIDEFVPSKELDALERGIIEFEKDLEDDCNNEWLKRVVAGMKKCYQRLEAIENANPSEALKCVENFFDNRKIYEPNNTYIIECTERLTAIKQSLLKAQEQEKVLEIIKPDLRLVGNFLQARMPLVEDNDRWIIVKEITDEKELDLLKKILG